jgi:ABC-type uncharacterized transport system substrate-binding protein
VKRREFITLLGGAAAAWPLTVRAQQTGKVRRIAWLSGAARGSADDALSGFPHGMRDLGYVEGRDFVIEWRLAEGRYERFADFAAEMVRLKVDVIVLGTPAAIRALGHRLPSIFVQREYTAAGGLMSYGENLRDFFRRAAAFVDKILKGAKPADLPIEQPTRFYLVINLNAANALGLEIPPSLLARADEVIE